MPESGLAQRVTSRARAILGAMTTGARRAIVCIGFMGAGKTTAARSAADALGTEAIDVDAVIERRVGKPINRMFDEDGEAAFRAVEEQVTLELLNGSWARVLSLGGGAIGSAAVRDALSDQLVIWIDVGPETAWRRAQATVRRWPARDSISSAFTSSASRCTRRWPTWSCRRNAPSTWRRCWRRSRRCRRARACCGPRATPATTRCTSAAACWRGGSGRPRSPGGGSWSPTARSGGCTGTR